MKDKEATMLTRPKDAMGTFIFMMPAVPKLI